MNFAQTKVTGKRVSKKEKSYGKASVFSEHNKTKNGIQRITNQELLCHCYCKMTSLSETGPLCFDS